MKTMDIDQMERAIIEITLGLNSPKLRKQFPEEYQKLIREIRGIIKEGSIVEISSNTYL